MPTKPLPEPPEPQIEAELVPELPVKEGVEAPDSPLPSLLPNPYSGFLVPQMSFQVQC